MGTTQDDDIDLDIDASSIESIVAVRPADVDPAPALTVARNVFVPLTTACRYTCTYCTYYDPPGQASLLTPEEVRSICAEGAAVGATEALFTFGDDPDDRYTEIHDQLAKWGQDSIHEYLRDACEIALEEGLLPHANPGDQTRAEMATVGEVNASMGVMLETTADVEAHGGPRSKSPGQRLRTIATAGELGIPFTTGILVGIGEGWRDRAESLLAIRALQERYGHVQEVIVQPVVENERWSSGEPSIETLRRTVAMARVALPPEVSVQVPPNLAPVASVLDCGVDDLGGVSPVTDDHINPAHAWPAMDRLRELAAEAGVPLRERLPVHQRYLPASLGPESGSPPRGRQWVPDRILDAIRGDDEAGDRFRAILDGKSLRDGPERADPDPSVSEATPRVE